MQCNFVSLTPVLRVVERAFDAYWVCRFKMTESIKIVSTVEEGKA